jgi:hypothetical protein
MVELVDGKPAHGSLAIIARNENVAHSRVLRLWQKLRTNQADPANALSDVSLTPKRKAARLGFMFPAKLVKAVRACLTICFPM